MHRLISLLLVLSVLLSASYAETAFWYTTQDPEGMTDIGRPFSDTALYAATNDYELGTILELTDVKTNESVVVLVVDRLPEAPEGWSIGITSEACHELNIQDKGKTEVSVDIIRGTERTIAKEQNTGWFSFYAGTYDLASCWKYYQRFLRNGLKPSIKVEKDGRFSLYIRFINDFEKAETDNALALSGIKVPELQEEENPYTRKGL